MSDLKSLEELQNMLKEAEITSASAKIKHVGGNDKSVHLFVEAFDIKDGTNKIPTYIFYYSYVLWCREHYKKPCGNTEFFRTFRKHCKPTRHGKQRFYYVNDDNKLTLTEEFYEKAKAYSKKPKPTSSTK